jgi:hypothetical protein
MAYDKLEDVVEAAPPGWRELVEPLWHLCQVEDVDIMQVKEKYGGLRFYIGPAPKYVQDLVNIVEARSYQICEVCGSNRASLVNIDHWLRTLCAKHHDEMKAISEVSDG